MGVLQFKVPIMQAPVGSAATASLASEVSRAGGLGALGASWTKPEVLRERIRSIQRVTDRPFCVNLVLDFEQDERLEVAVEERAPVASFSFGLRPHLIARARAGGALVLVQVASADAARAAADAGADALIVQGVEAGGHVQGVVGLLPLLAEVRRAVSLRCLPRAGSEIRPRRVPRSLVGPWLWSWAPDSWQVTSATHTHGTRRACSKPKLATLC